MKDIAKFIAGFERFQAKYFREEHGLFSRLRQGQQPRALVISCCDSRVDPAMLTGADPGDLFAILVSLDNLLSFPWIRERVDRNMLTLHGWYFDIDSGELLAYSAETATFDALVSGYLPNQGTGA